MTNKLKYFIGNWKMFGDFGDFKIIHKINQFTYESRKLLKKKEDYFMCTEYIDSFLQKKNLYQNLFH